MYAWPLSGKGASIKGARWNSSGTELIYTAENRSLAMAEVVVHFSLGTLPDDYRMFRLLVPDNLKVITVHQKDLPDDWNAFPHSASTQRIGDEFALKNDCCLLRVPSAVTKGDYNLLINPMHPDFSRIEVLDSEPFPFDKRIFKSTAH